MKRVDVHIERLVIRGLAPGDAPAFARSFRDRLEQALRAGDAPAHLIRRGNAAAIRARTARVPAGAGASAAGARAAAAVAERVVS